MQKFRKKWFLDFLQVIAYKHKQKKRGKNLVKHT